MHLSLLEFEIWLLRSLGHHRRSLSLLNDSKIIPAGDKAAKNPPGIYWFSIFQLICFFFKHTIIKSVLHRSCFVTEQLYSIDFDSSTVTNFTTTITTFTLNIKPRKCYSRGGNNPSKTPLFIFTCSEPCNDHRLPSLMCEEIATGNLQSGGGGGTGCVNI